MTDRPVKQSTAGVSKGRRRFRKPRLGNTATGRLISDQLVADGAAMLPTWLSLAVIQPTEWTITGESDLGRTVMDDRQTVLKTAGLASACVH